MTTLESAATPGFLDVLLGTPLEACFTYWRERRLGRAVPLKAAIDPVDMPRRILPNLFIYQRMADERFRCRLAGTDLCRVFKHNPTGHYLDDLLVPTVLSSRQRLFSEVLERAMPVIYGGRLTHSEHSWIGFRRLLLPLSATGQRPDHVFGMVIFPDIVHIGHHREPPADGLPDLEAWARPEDLEAEAWEPAEDQMPAPRVAAIRA